MTELRNTSFTGDSKADAFLSAENARDANAALAERLVSFVATIEYAARGSTTEHIPVQCASRPSGVLLLNAYLKSSPGDDLGSVGRCNFVWDAATSSARVFEPSGLTANSVYVLSFLVVG